MVKEFVLLALMQVPSADIATYDLQPVEYFETMHECQLNRKVRVVTKDAPSFQCMRRDFK